MGILDDLLGDMTIQRPHSNSPLARFLGGVQATNRENIPGYSAVSDFLSPRKNFNVGPDSPLRWLYNDNVSPNPNSPTAPVDAVAPPGSRNSAPADTQTGQPPAGNVPTGNMPSGGVQGDAPPQDPASDIGTTYNPVEAMTPQMRQIYMRNNQAAQATGRPQNFTYNPGYLPQAPMMSDSERASANQDVIDSALMNRPTSDEELMPIVPIHSLPPEAITATAATIRPYLIEEGMDAERVNALSDEEIIQISNELAKEMNKQLQAERARQREESGETGGWQNRNPVSNSFIPRDRNPAVGR